MVRVIHISNVCNSNTHGCVLAVHNQEFVLVRMSTLKSPRTIFVDDFVDEHLIKHLWEICRQDAIR